MIYRFRSRADGDIVMLQATAERVLALLGKTAGAPGILEPADMPAARAALEGAVQADDEVRQALASGREPAAEAPAGAASGPLDAVSLRRRVWPLVEMIKRAQAEDTPVLWGA